MDDPDAGAGQIDALLRDEVTGVYRRVPGLAELEREVVKSHRTGEPFSLAIVAIDGLTAVTDTEGDQAADWLVVRVAAAISSVLREYDIIARYGDDEFACGMQGLQEATARTRFEGLRTILAEDGTASASVGVAELRPDESLPELIDRAGRDVFRVPAR